MLHTARFPVAVIVAVLLLSMPLSSPAQQAVSPQPPSFLIAQAGGPPEVDLESGAGRYEKIILDTPYSLDLLAGYGYNFIFARPHSMVTVFPAVSFPISGVLAKDSNLLRGVLEWRVEGVLGLFVSHDDRGEAGLSPAGMVYNFTGFTGPFVPYLQGQLGMVYVNTPKELQRGGFNFILSGAVGSKYFVSDSLALDLQVRYQHISNAGLREPNPGLDTLHLLLGICYY